MFTYKSAAYTLYVIECDQSPLKHKVKRKCQMF